MLNLKVLVRTSGKLNALQEASKGEASGKKSLLSTDYIRPSVGVFGQGLCTKFSYTKFFRISLPCFYRFVLLSISQEFFVYEKIQT